MHFLFDFGKIISNGRKKMIKLFMNEKNNILLYLRNFDKNRIVLHIKKIIILNLFSQNGIWNHLFHIPFYCFCPENRCFDHTLSNSMWAIIFDSYEYVKRCKFPYDLSRGIVIRFFFIKNRIFWFQTSLFFTEYFSNKNDKFFVSLVSTTLSACYHIQINSMQHWILFNEKYIIFMKIHEFACSSHFYS